MTRSQVRILVCPPDPCFYIEYNDEVPGSNPGMPKMQDVAVKFTRLLSFFYVYTIRMFITPHVAVGTAIGIATGNPILGFFGGFASHYILDAVPHTDSGTWHFYESFTSHDLHAGDFIVGILDMSIALFGYMWLAGITPIAAAPAIAGAIGGAIPDSIVLLGLFYPPSTKWRFLNKYFTWSEQHHRTARPNQWVLGILTQLTVTGLSIWYLLKV